MVISPLSPLVLGLESPGLKDLWFPFLPDDVADLRGELEADLQSEPPELGGHCTSCRSCKAFCSSSADQHVYLKP